MMDKEDIDVCSDRSDSPQSAFAPSSGSPGVAGASKETASRLSDDSASIKAGVRESGAERVAPTPQVQILPRTRFLVFGAIFYILLLSYLIIVLFFPQSRIAHFSAVFETFWAQFIFLILCLSGVTLSVFGLFCFVFEEYLKSGWYQPKIGKLSVSEGFITKEELNQVLEEQEQRIGEVLLVSGRITPEHLEKALAQQKSTPARLGEIINQMGYASEEDVYWALGKMQRKVGEILVEKGMVTKEDVAWLIDRQKRGPRRI
jgi:hypothetical protein